jgi:DNA-binding transcriptional MerR regulator/methylmalonyl-CoA mutase cobalamin-binding subunit
MNDRAAVRPITVSIAAVERDTGLSKDTLRVWERRYGFPTPERDQFGERAYPLEQVEKLRLVRRLLDSGHRPGRVVKLSVEELQRVSESLATTPQRIVEEHEVNLRGYLDYVKQHDVDGLRRALSQATLKLGLARFVTDLIAPLNVMIGDAWLRGQVEVFEEHMYTESVNVVLRNALASIPQAASAGRPRVLLTTFPQEPHGLGLLMAETLFALEGGKCLSLGVQTPIWDIVLAATAARSDVVALSFTASLNPNYVINGLQELREKLPRSIEIWAGGQCPVIHRKEVGGVVAIAELQDLRHEMSRWRAEHP